MPLPNDRLLILPLDHSEVFSTDGSKLAARLGPSELIYAAVAMFSFDDTGVAESLIDSNPLLEYDIIYWLEDALTSMAQLFLNIRTFHNEQVLDEVVFDIAAETLYVSSKAPVVFYGRRRLPTGFRL